MNIATIGIGIPNADRVRNAVGGAGVYIYDVKDCGNDRFTVVVQFNSQPVHGHRDSAWIVSKQLTKRCIDHTIESSTEKSAVGDGLNGTYGVWEHLVSVHIHHPETLKPAYINEEVMLDLKSSINENRILELVHKRFFKENGRDPKNARELLNYARKKNGKTTDCDKAVEKHEKELHEGAVGLIVNVLNGRKVYSVSVDDRGLDEGRLDEISSDLKKRYINKAVDKVDAARYDYDDYESEKQQDKAYLNVRNRVRGIKRAVKGLKESEEDRLDEIFDNTPKGRAKLIRYQRKNSESWSTNRDAVDGAALNKDWKAADKYNKRLAKRNKGLRLSDQRAEKFRDDEDRIDEIFDDTAKGRAKELRYINKAQKSWMTNFDAEIGAREREKSGEVANYSNTAKIGEYRREQNKRNKGLAMLRKKLARHSGGEQ